MDENQQQYDRVNVFGDGGVAIHRSKAKVASAQSGAALESIAPFIKPGSNDGDEDEPLAFDTQRLAMLHGQDRRAAWAEVDLNAIRANLKLARGCVGPQTRVMCVVKADAYGHGAVRVAQSLASAADYFAVATVSEGVELRHAGITTPILILSQPPVTSIPLLLAYRLSPSVYETSFAIAYAETADSVHLNAPFHLVVNTGMNRIGVRYDQVVDFMTQVSFHRAVELQGVFTHFATADDSNFLDFKMQARRFLDAVNSLCAAGISPGIVHCANSAATMRYPDVHLDMVRWGISLYGYNPSKDCAGILDLKPAMSIHARVVDARFLNPGEGVGYGLRYKSLGQERCCTIPIGYADGLHRILSGRMNVMFNGKFYRQVGNICMDQCMFIAKPEGKGLIRDAMPNVGDEVIIVGRSGNLGVSMDDLAAQAGTISYEMMCGFGQRLERVYV